MRLQFRCLQIDLARQKERVDFVCRYADFAAEHGYNALLLYLENAVRTQSTPFFREEETYSEEEIAQIVAYAESKGLDVIPALENLGHLEKFFLYPELEDLSEITDGSVQGRGFEKYPRGACGCVSNPKLNEFFDRYITEVCSLFHSPYVHMGLDEPFDFAVCEKCRAELDAGATKSELFYRQIIHSYELCKKLGKTMMMWDDFFEYAPIAERLPRDIILCNWNYVFIGDEPQGHWTNRIKTDWFRLYDELGFRYLFCVYAHRASSLYNVDTFGAYAEKYHPAGAIMTTWRRSDSFYFGAYPSIAYAGETWSGKIGTREETVALYASLLGGSRELAELVLSMNLVECGSNLNVTEYCENDSMIKLCYRNALSYAVNRLETLSQNLSGQAKDIATDIYDYAYEILLNLSLQELAVRVFDGYETHGADACKLSRELEEIKAGFAKIKRNGDFLWRKYREGIVSFDNAFERKFRNYSEKITAAQKRLSEETPRGVLYAEMMLYDPYPTVRNRVVVRYEDGEEEEIFVGALKPNAALFDWGGCYGYRFAIRDKKIAWMDFSVWGEGAYYPTHFRCVAGGKKYVAASAERLEGEVVRTENLLFDDTRFAEMGIDDGIAHFNDIELSKRRHTVRVRFRPLGEEKA